MSVRQSRHNIYHEMDNRTYAALSQRLDELETQIAVADQKTSLRKQLNLLKRQVRQIYNENKDYESLKELMDDLKVWESIDDRVDKEHESSCGSKTDSDVKREIILANYDFIKRLDQDFLSLSNFDTADFINPSKITQTKSIYSELLGCKLSSKEEEMKRISDYVHLLTIKSMIVFERFSSILEEEDDFWVDVKSKMETLNSKVNIKKSQINNANKY